MFQVECSHCGASEDDHVTVEKMRKESAVTSPRSMISESCRTILNCDTCEIEETVETGILPASKSDHFIKRESNSESRLVASISGTELEFIGVDESYSQDSHYTPSGVRGTSNIHHVHIHAQNPPTISKGVHQVNVGEFIDERMRLGNVRYHGDSERTLKFYRVLSDSTPEPISRPSPATSHSDIWP